jgi:DNA-binding NarL/FixJ family response regulator
LEVVRLVACGLHDREIASRLNLSVRTIHGLVSAALAKLGVSSRVQLACLVWTGGAVPAEAGHRHSEDHASA